MQNGLSRVIRLVALLMGTSTLSLSAEKNDEAIIQQLNASYIEAFLTCDVECYRELLAEDFRGVLADGREIDKAEFLKQSAVPPLVTHFRNREVMIRVYGNAALVNAEVIYRRPDGTESQTRYVNVYVRRNGRWQVVSAQLTRVAVP